MSATDNHDDDFHLFRQAMQDVTPLKHDKVLLKAKKRLRRPRDTSQATAGLQHFGDSETEATVCSQRILSYSVPGIQHKVMQKLRQGRFPIDATMDLHGLTVVKAQHELEHFLREALRRQYRLILVIHGKGKSTPNNPPILKNRVNNWLRHHPEILAFCSARQSDGGTGAVYVLLRQSLA